MTKPVSDRPEAAAGRAAIARRDERRSAESPAESSAAPARDGAFRLTRREFLGASAGSFVLGFVLPSLAGVDEAQAATLTQVNSWLTIGSDESITLTIGASEMGQGSFSGLAQILAEDLMVAYSRIATVQGGPTLANPAPVGTAINTVGSSVTRTNYWKMRDAGASARETLVLAAMNRQGDPTRANYAVANGVIAYTPTGATYTYGQVAVDASLLTPVTGAALVPDNALAVIGKTQARQDIPAKVDGSAKYGIDVRLPNMAYAVIRHCPTFGGTLAQTPAVPGGMIAVVPVAVIAGTGRGTEVTGAVNAVAVVGPDTWNTWRAAKAMSVSWNLPANASTLNNANFTAQAQALLASATPYVAGGANPPGTLYTVEGDAPSANAAIAACSAIVDATYSLPYVAHACMEVLNCTVDYVPGVRLDIYAPTQSSKSVLTTVAKIPGLNAPQINVHTTYLGGGLGRKAEVDFVCQAVQVAMALPVKRPVKLMWPREEDFTRDQYRPMALIHARAGLDVNNNIAGWAYRNVSPSILGQRGVPLGAAGDSQGIEGAQALPYNLGTRLTEYVTHPSPIPVGFWRSVGASLNTFAVESMIDELAWAAGGVVDPYLFRRARITDPRWLAVLDAAASLAGWSTPPAAGRARGIAIGTAFNSIVAQVVEVSGTSTSWKVVKVSVALDAYITVNPGQVEAQLTGGVVHGLNAALYGRQNFVNGAAQAKNFNNSRMIRMSEMPAVSVTVARNPSASSRAVAIGGVGELGVPTLAPALANAYYALTKQRVRTLPFFPTATMGGL